MYCPNCDLQSETDVARVIEHDEAARYRKWFDDEDVRGDYDIEDVGDPIEVEKGDGSAAEWAVALRVDICANCAVPIDARTYCRN